MLDRSVIYEISFGARETLPKKIAARAEQLIRRFINDGMRCEADLEPAIPGESLHDFLVKNGVLEPSLGDE